MSIGYMKWDRLTSSIGRNGNIKTSGVEFYTNGILNMISIHPITSKGNLGNCMITIPIEAIDEFIHQLELIKLGNQELV